LSWEVWGSSCSATWSTTSGTGPGSRHIPGSSSSPRRG